MEERCMPRYRLLAEAQLQALHRATVEVLETVGVRVLHEQALALLQEAGCRLEEHEIVKIPGRLVEEALKRVPAAVRIYDRHGQEAMHLGGEGVYFGLGTDLLHTVDPDSGRVRPSRLGDVVDAARVADGCKNIDFVASQAFPTELPPNLGYVAEFKAMVEHTTKPIYFTAAAAEDLAVILEMAAAVRGGEQVLRNKPFLIHYAEPVSPLVHSRGALEKMFLCARKGIPLNYVPAVLMGASGPVTLAGAVVQANAEALSGLVIQQLYAPGAPMISGFSVTPMDMRTGTSVYAAPEERLTHTACTELFRSYGLPVWGTAGCSDAKSLDVQAAFEAGVTLLMSALDGAHLIHDVGYLGQGLVGSPASIVFCDEVIGYVKRILRGFSLDAEHLAVDVIRRVGPGGSYLADRHTLEHFRECLWHPPGMDRDPLDRWRLKGEKGYQDNLRDRTRRLLAEHHPAPLAARVSTRLAEIMALAERDLDNRLLEV